MSSNSSSSNGGVGFTGLLQIAFIVLKLCGVIRWSWLWVLSPIWLVIAIFLVVTLVLGIYYWRKSVKEKRKLKTSLSKWQQRMNDLQKAQSSSKQNN